jgi:thioredoxin 1
MLLNTRLEHLASEAEFQKAIKENENLMICCGRMGPMCLPVYKAMEDLKDDYSHIAFRDMAFDMPDAHVIKNLPECNGFMGLPFTVYFKNGEVVAATTSIQSKDEVKTILDNKF